MRVAVVILQEQVKKKKNKLFPAEMQARNKVFSGKYPAHDLAFFTGDVKLTANSHKK